MKTVKQLLRQPVKTLTGIVLMTLSVAILCTCVGQAIAVHTTKETLNDQFSTVAIPRGEDRQNSISPILSKEFVAWIEKTAQEYPDVVSTVSRLGLLSAYIPELTPLNMTTEKYLTELVTREHLSYYFYQSTPRAMPYTCAMLVITLDEIGEIEAQTAEFPVEGVLTAKDFPTTEEYVQWLTGSKKETVTTGYTVELTGTVTDVVSLQEGYRDPRGRIARLTLNVPTMEQIQALDLVAGEQYVVYGMDYVDEYWRLIGQLNHDGQYDWIQFEPFDPSSFHLLTEKEREAYKNRNELMPDGRWVNRFGYFHGIALNEAECDMVNAISMTLALPVSLTEYEDIREDGDGKLLELRPITGVTYTGKNGEAVTVSSEEYTQRYQIPTIARLDGTVEDFLASDRGASWQKALARDAINNQAFTVIGVDKMSYLADFNLEKSKIVTGRDFTAQELESGERVCIIHEELAIANGLQVGDTFTASFYTTDYALPYQDFRTENRGILNPSASFYFDTTPFTETAEYTVVGICRGERTFPDVAQNEYAFSANTIYVPMASVQTEMETCDSIAFVAPVLYNGKIEDFHALAMQSGYAGRFRYNDQGYSVIAGNFHNYEALAREILAVGIAVYAVLTLLFLLLYPGSRRGNVRTMESLGAASGRRFRHVLASSMGIVVPASVLGCLLGTLLWDCVADALQKSADTTVKLQIDPKALVAVALAQLGVALILNLIAAVFVSAPRGMSRRR